MVNICIFNGDMSRGGGTERITQVLSGILADRRDYHIWVLSLNNESGKSYYPIDARVEFEILPHGGLAKKVVGLFRFVKKQRIDVLINVDVMLGILSIPVKFLCPHLKLITWEMFNIHNDIGSKYTKLVRKISLMCSSYYINQTEGDMKAFQKKMHPYCKMTYIYNPCTVDTSYKEYDVESKVIVTAGNFYYSKGFDLAVEVAGKVFSKHPDWIWKFYGDGELFEDIRKQVEISGLEKNILFCGRTKKIVEEYKKSSMYVMTSRTEGFGLVLTEAKSCNLPTLAFDVDFGPREIIDDGISGYLIRDFNVELMAEKICVLIENPSLRLQFSKHAQENLNKFTKQEFYERWVEVIEDVLKK